MFSMMGMEVERHVSTLDTGHDDGGADGSGAVNREADPGAMELKRIIVQKAGMAKSIIFAGFVVLIESL